MIDILMTNKPKIKILLTSLFGRLLIKNTELGLSSANYLAFISKSLGLYAYQKEIIPKIMVSLMKLP